MTNKMNRAAAYVATLRARFERDAQDMATAREVEARRVERMERDGAEHAASVAWISEQDAYRAQAETRAVRASLGLDMPAQRYGTGR